MASPQVPNTAPLTVCDLLKLLCCQANDGAAIDAAAVIDDDSENGNGESKDGKCSEKGTWPTDAAPLSDYIVVARPVSTPWAALYQRMFIDTTLGAVDDLLYYVRYDPEKVLPSNGLAVVRRHTRHVPAANDTTVNWEESVRLMVALHCVSFVMTTVVRRAGKGDGAPDVLAEIRRDVYASPDHSTGEMDKGGKPLAHRLTYPTLYFHMHDWDDSSASGVYWEGDIFSLTLTGEIVGCFGPTKLFSGCMSYASMSRGYQQKSHSGSHLGSLFKSAASARHFIDVGNPQLPGKARLALKPVTESRRAVTSYSLFGQPIAGSGSGMQAQVMYISMTLDDLIGSLLVAHREALV